MTSEQNGMEAATSDDEKLTAYLDGALPADEKAEMARRLVREPALQARADALAAGLAGLGEAFAALAEAAPADRLSRNLDAALAAASVRRGATRRHWMAAAAAIVLVVAGGGAGYFGGVLLDERRAADADWREVVAEYMTLYTNDTLADLPSEPSRQNAELARVGAKLDLGLDLDKVALPGLELKRAQMLELKGAPLAQLAYVSAQGPIAFCIMPSGDGEHGLEYETRSGHGIVYWEKGGHAFMLIGGAPREELETLATSLAARVS